MIYLLDPWLGGLYPRWEALYLAGKPISIGSTALRCLMLASPLLSVTFCCTLFITAYKRIDMGEGGTDSGPIERA